MNASIVAITKKCPHILRDHGIIVCICDVTIDVLQHHKTRGIVTVDDVWRGNCGSTTLAPIYIGQLMELFQRVKLSLTRQRSSYLTMSCRD